MRVYTRLQAQLSKIADVKEYRYRVDTDNIGDRKDFIVAGIIFKDCKKDQGKSILSFYIFKIGQGFQEIQLVYELRKPSKEILLVFNKVAITGEIPNFDEENSAEKCLNDVISELTNEFNGKIYGEEGRDIFKLIEKFGWGPEVARLKSQRSSHKWVYIVTAVAVLAIGGWLLWKSDRKA